METHTTLTDAREAARDNGALTVIEIEHADLGTRYIACKATLRVLDAALERKPMAEIKALVAEYPVDEVAPEAHRCERCGVDVDDNAYRQHEQTHRGRVVAYYCDDCARVLRTVGAGEHTALEERRVETDGAEYAHKSDI